MGIRFCKDPNDVDSVSSGTRMILFERNWRNFDLNCLEDFSYGTIIFCSAGAITVEHIVNNIMKTAPLQSLFISFCTGSGDHLHGIRGG